jgi:dephospho-CoA kinase
MGCLAIDSDAQVREAYEDPAVRDQVRRWWGSEAFTPEGKVDRRAVALHIFASAQERNRLEQLIHPLVGAARDRQMAASAANPAVLAFVWDTPLLFEKGLNRECDAVVYIDADFDQRLRRVADSRGWSEEELCRRENLQWPLDKKRSFSDYVIQSPADAEELRRQVHQTLSRILANKQ